METHSRKKTVLFILSILGYLISSSIVWFVPMATAGNEPWRKNVGYALGTLFWLGLVAGFVFLFLLNRLRKKKLQKKKAHKKRIPLVSFFNNKVASVFDILLILGFIGIFFVVFFNGLNQWLSFGLIFVFLFSLEMHGMFNGENFKFICKKDTVSSIEINGGQKNEKE